MKAEIVFMVFNLKVPSYEIEDCINNYCFNLGKLIIYSKITI